MGWRTGLGQARRKVTDVQVDADCVHAQAPAQGTPQQRTNDYRTSPLLPFSI
jgi:hypothetical protein